MWVNRLKNFFKAKQSTLADEDLELTPAQLRSFDFWLNFDPAVEALYEAETSADRIAHLRWVVYVGLIFYNAYNITDVILHGDIVILSWTLRILVITPSSLLLAWLIMYMPARLRELSAMLGMMNSISVPTLLFYLSSNPLSLYSVIEIPVVLIFGCLMLVLRFPHAFAFTVTTLLMSLLAIMMRPGISPNLQFVFSFQIFSLCVFVLIGNYKIEAVRRGVYLQELQERVRSKMLEKDRHALTVISNTDFLTGVSNRRYFEDMFALKWRDKSALALLMIDIDFFKQFNDTYGHQMGDTCLCAVVEALKTQVRSRLDMLARFGGEEFVVVLSEVTIEMAEEIADRIRAAVQAAMIPHATRPDGLGVVTISVGAVFVNSDRTETPQLILRMADHALYDAKHLGRNRVVVTSCNTAAAD